MNYCVDLSSNNPPPNLDQHWAAGHRILILKTSEGTGYAWAGSVDLAAKWHAKGGIVGHYHFLTPGDGSAQADWFFDHVRSQLGVGDFLVVDVEKNGCTAAEVNAFIDRVGHNTLARWRGLIYGSPSFLTANKVVSRAGWRLWVAHYGVNKPDLPAGWGDYILWQFNDRAKVAGCPAPVDYSQYREWLAQPDLRYGDRCFAVLRLKELLHKAGCGQGLLMSSDKFGGATRRNVTRFKKRHGWSTQPVVVGARMWAALSKGK